MKVDAGAGSSFSFFAGKPARGRWGHGDEVVGLAVWPEGVTWRGAGESLVGRGEAAVTVPSQVGQGEEGAFPFPGAPAPMGCGRHGREPVTTVAQEPTVCLGARRSAA